MPSLNNAKKKFWYLPINLLCCNSISCLLGRWVCCLVQLFLLGYIDLLFLLGQQCLLLSGHIGQKINLLAELKTSVESTDDRISIVNSNRADVCESFDLSCTVHSLYCSSVISTCSCAAL